MFGLPAYLHQLQFESLLTLQQVEACTYAVSHGAVLEAIMEQPLKPSQNSPNSHDGTGLTAVVNGTAIIVARQCIRYQTRVIRVMTSK